MPHYFFTANANRRILVGQYRFEFEPVHEIGGAWEGVLQTENDDQSEALRQVKSVSEISQADYDAILKKKPRTPGWSGSGILAATDPSRPPSVNPAAGIAGRAQPIPVAPKETISDVLFPTPVTPPREVVSHRPRKET